MKFVPSRRVGAVVLVTAVTGGSVVAGIATAATSLKIDAVNGKLAFTKKSAKAKSGKVTIRMANPSSFPHAIAIKGKGVNKKGKVVKKGGTSVVTATLKKGSYEFYCPVKGHEAGGMKGTLKVS
jgi:plastocyanin